METYKEVKRRFLPTLDRHEHIIPDSSRVTTFKQCRRKYFYQYVLCRVQKEDMPYIYFGGAYHKFREILSVRFMKWREEQGSNYNALNIRKDFPDGFVLEAIKAALDYYSKNGDEPRPGTRYDFLTKARLFQACKVAMEHWYAEKEKGSIEVIGIETPINFEYSNGKRKTGRVDEFILWRGKLWVRDFKCSAKDPKYYPKSLQIKDQAYTYIIGLSKLSDGKKIEGIIYEQMYNDKPLKSGDNGKKGPSIHSHLIQFTDAQLTNWELEQELIHDQMDDCRERDIYPMSENDLACNWCPYYDVCNAMNQNQMVGMLMNNYKLHIWDNMAPVSLDE